jgi:hypothetical protein
LAEYQEKEKELKDMTKTISLLKKRLENSKNKKGSDEIVEQSKKILEEQKLLKVEKKGAKDLLDEFDYMENLTTLEKFREFMLTRHYWADTWAISTIERLLNIKVVLLSEEAFKSGDLDSVMQCGQLNDVNLEEAGSFVPDYYIIACYTGNHYKLISYKEKHIFKFREIPYDVKIMIINKCLEKNSGPYYLIQDFRNMKTKLGLHPNGTPLISDSTILTNYLKYTVPKSQSVILGKIPLVSKYVEKGAAFTLLMFEDGSCDISLEVPQRGQTRRHRHDQPQGSPTAHAPRALQQR